MKFKDFITRQRVIILCVGLLTLTASLIAAHFIGEHSEAGEFLVDVAASTGTVVFTVFIIDYLTLNEEADKNRGAASMAEDEIQATCIRIRWGIAKLYGLKNDEKAQRNIGNRKEAGEYLNAVYKNIEQFLDKQAFKADNLQLQPGDFSNYRDTLHELRQEIEQEINLYGFALPHELRDEVTNLRSELQIGERLLGFVTVDDRHEPTTKNLQLLAVITQSLQESTHAVLERDSHAMAGESIKSRNGRFSQTL